MMKALSLTQKAVFALIILTASFAALSVVARYLNNDFTILQQVYMRVLVALLLSLLIFRKHLRWRRFARLPHKEWGVLIFRSVVSYVAAVPLISLAANLTTIGNIAFIAALPFVPVLGVLLYKEKITWWKVMFICLSFFGVSLLALHDLRNPLSWGYGDILAIIANIAFAISFVTRRWHSNALNNQEITVLTFILGVGALIIASVAVGEGMPKLDNSMVIWTAILLGGIFNVANLFFLNYSFQHLSAIQAGNMLNLEAAWGLLFGWILYQEWPSLQGLFGGIVIIASVIGMNFYSKYSAAKLPAANKETTTLR